MKNLMFAIPLLIILLMGKITKGQDYPSEYYNVINKDSLYVFSSDTHILFFSSPGEDGNFSYLSNIQGNFTSSTNMAFNDEYFIVEDSDILFLFDISDIYHPSLLSTASFEFAVEQVYGFGPHFVIKVADILKLLEISSNSLEVIEDTLLVLSRQPLVKYPYIIMRRNIYKYVENFGAFQIYFMDEVGDAGMRFQFLAEDKIVYTTILYSPWPFPPSVCGIRARLIQEPDFPFAFIDNWWADCLPVYIHEYYAGSKRYIYLMDWRLPPNGGRIVVNFAGGTLYQHFSWDYELKLTDVYLFQLGDSVLYSTPNSSSVFHHLEYIITTVEENKAIPNSIILKNNYPNPFNPVTIIEYQIHDFSFINLTVTNLLGEKVAVLVNEEKPAGNYKVSFNGTNLPSGIYFYQITAGSYTRIKKMVLMK